MTTCEGFFRVIGENYTEEFVLIDMDGNHCRIANKHNVLFDGYILEGYEVFEQKAKEQKAVAEFAGWTFERIK